MDDAPAAATCEIAVVGMAARVAGAATLAEFWQMLITRRDGIGPIPAERWDAARLHGEGKAVPDRGGFLDGVDLFDPAFFGISPREAVDLDPQQRLMLEASWQALEDAGQPASALHRSKVGVYVGGGWNDYEALRRQVGTETTPHSIVGAQLDGISARVSYFLGLAGPSLTVSTGCSGSLVALHLAVQALKAGEIEGALVGGVNLMLIPDNSVGLTHLEVLSPRGRCNAFGADADGYVRGEGALAVFLKPLESAVAAGDRIYGLIVHTAVNQDGGGDSFVTPSPTGQEDLLRDVYGRRGLSCEDVVYIEAHGTGTRRGDPIEASAIGSIVGRARTGPSPIGIGSVKTNVGHLEPAAGLAGLVKVLLAAHHGVVPPSLGAEKLNPEIAFEDLGLRVAREPLPLPERGGLMGVNSFGWGGTNAHAVVGRAPVAHRRTVTDPVAPAVLAVSAHTADALVARAQDLSSWLSTEPAPPTLGPLAGTLAWRRDQLPHRAAFVADDVLTAAADMAAFATDPEHSSSRWVSGRATARREVAFLFPGQGSQWEGMGRELYRQNEAFAHTIDRCCAALAPHVRDVERIFTGESDGNWLSELGRLQPALWAVTVALAEVWRDAGVEPDVVIGHSQGEVAAATIAGHLSYDDAALVVASRSRLAERACGQGLMLAVDLDVEATRTALRGFESVVSVAAHNGARSCVLAGETEAILMLKELLEAEGVYCGLVNVDYASHSPQMDSLSEALREDLSTLVPRDGTVRMMSTVYADLIEGRALDAEYWAANLRRMVRMSESMERLLDAGVSHVIEISPHPVLTPAVEQIAEGRDGVSVLASLRRGEGSRRDLAFAFSRAYVAGLHPFSGLPSDSPCDLPLYPWQRQRYWLAERRRRAPTRAEIDAAMLPSLDEPDVWHGSVDLDVDGWLADHRIHDAPVVPATAIMELFLRAGRRVLGEAPVILEDVEFQRAVPAVESSTLGVVWRVEQESLSRCSLRVLEPETRKWIEHAMARVPAAPPPVDLPRFPGGLLGAAALEAAEFYSNCAARGLDYRTAFRRVESIRLEGDDALGRIEPDSRWPARDAPTGLHAAAWDCCMQVALALLPGAELCVPTRVGRLCMFASDGAPSGALWAHASRVADKISIDVFDADRRPVLRISGLQLSQLPSATDGTTGDDRIHQLVFTEAPAPSAERRPDQWIIAATHADCDHVAKLEAAIATTGARATSVGLDGPDTAALEALSTARSRSEVVIVAPDAGAGLEVQELALLGVAEIAATLASWPIPPSVTLVTRRAQAVADDSQVDPGAALYWGFARVLRREHPELTPVVVDTDPDDDDWPHWVVREVQTAIDDDQVVLRASQRYVGRIRRGRSSTGETDTRRWATPYQPFALATRRPGLWDGLVFAARARRAPTHTEIEIEVDAAALNFIDVMKALGTYPDESADATWLGGECAGRVVGLGSAVEHFSVGDRVVACGTGMLGSHATVDAAHVSEVPEGMANAAAVTIPLAMMTAWHSLVELARVRPGETVLVHSAAGGLGLAAVEVSRHLGATVIATAGTEEKRAHLRTLGVREVFDSRDLSWVEGVRTITEGRGVNVILNSLSGAAISHGLVSLSEGGRFVEVGKVDIYADGRIPLEPFRKAIGVFSVDLAGMMQRHPRRFADLLATVWSLIRAGELSVLPYRTRPFAEAAEALREMARGRHVGKIVLTSPQSVGSIAPRPLEGGRVRPDATYLLTGGLGALGLSLAEFLADRGARSIALLGQSRPTIEAHARIDALRSNGVTLSIHQADVRDRESLADAVSDVRATMAELRGVFHLAGALDDATIANVTRSQLERVVRAKLDGALHLDAICESDQLDVFVLFSSAATLVGSPGQALYAAANAGLDALAVARRRRGLPALSVQWGPFEDVGLAAQARNRGERLEARGMAGFAATEAWEALASFLESETDVIAYFPLDLRQWFDAYPDAAAQPSWSLLAAVSSDGHQSGAGRTELADRIRDAVGGQRVELVEGRVRDLAAAVLRLDGALVEPDVPLKAIGLDSLMGLELRNRLESELGLRLSPTLLWTHGTPRALAHALSEQLADGGSGASELQTPVVKGGRALV